MVDNGGLILGSSAAFISLASGVGVDLCMHVSAVHESLSKPFHVRSLSIILV